GRSARGVERRGLRICNGVELQCSAASSGSAGVGPRAPADSTTRNVRRLDSRGGRSVIAQESVAARRLAELPPYLFVEIDRKKREAAARGVDVINLGIGDPDLPTPTPIVRALAKAARNPANH